MGFNIINNRVIIQPDAVPPLSTIVYVPDQYKPLPVTGTVLHAGEKCQTLKRGDRVYFPLMTGVGITVNQIECTILREPEILATIQPTSTQPKPNLKKKGVDSK